MVTLKFTIVIKANPEKVWVSLWESNNYTVWTSPFCEGSHYKTESFTQGSKIHLLSPKGGGMFSILEKIEENKFLAFKHLGELVNFNEMPIIGEINEWSGALETYQLSKTDFGTTLDVCVDTIESYIVMMNKLFPLSLNKVKELAEL